MVRQYVETPEDREITKPYRWYNGKKIDIRWSGGWLTPEGQFYSVDYANGVTHETIANEHGNRICGSGSIMTRPPIMRIFDTVKWMRIAYLEGSMFVVLLKGTLVGGSYPATLNEEDRNVHIHRRQAELLNFVQGIDGWDNYFINDTMYSCYQEFISAIRNNDVRPTKGESETSSIAISCSEDAVAEIQRLIKEQANSDSLVYDRGGREGDGADRMVIASVATQVLSHVLEFVKPFLPKVRKIGFQDEDAEWEEMKNPTQEDIERCLSARGIRLGGEIIDG
jgi:hypothetical protein